jgi:hypothetical protein
MLRSLITVLALVLLLATPALAQLEDGDYVSKFFGTTAAFAVDKQLAPESGWWGDMLPPALTADNSLIISTVNGIRTANKVEPLLGQDEYVMLWGQEGINTDGKYYYTLDFQGLRPSEVQAVFAALGGVEQALPGATLSFWPMNKRNYYFSALALGEDILCYINGEEKRVAPGASVTQVKQDLSQMFLKQYGVEVNLDVYLNQYVFADGGGGADLSIYALMPTDMVPVLQYPDSEGGAPGE